MEKEAKKNDELHLGEESQQPQEPQELEEFIQIRTNANPDTNKETKAEVKDSEERKMDSSKTFFIALGIFIAILIAIFFIPKFFNQEPLTLSEVHEKNIEAGKDTDTQYVYNSYSFVYYDGLWYTQIYNQISEDTYDVPLHFGPKNLTDIIITGDLNTYFGMLMKNNISNYTYQTYLTFDPNETEMGYIALATGELTQNLARTFGIAFIPACTQEGTGCENVPIITCNSTNAPVVYMKSGEPTVVYASGNCITIQGNGQELVRAVDRFLLKLYNIMI